MYTTHCNLFCTFDCAHENNDDSYLVVDTVQDASRWFLKSASSIMGEAEEDLPPPFPFPWEDYVGFGVAILGLLLAAGGGIGGGILVPAHILLLEFLGQTRLPLGIHHRLWRSHG
jgi:hypothetical protein